VGTFFDSSRLPIGYFCSLWVYFGDVALGKKKNLVSLFAGRLIDV
jgi:hypothetical protein